MKTSKKLKNKYDSFYSDKSEKWRRIGAAGKVQNILKVINNIQIENLIDIGAGDGNVLSLLHEKKVSSNMSALEISDSAIEQIKKKNITSLTEIKQFDGYKIPYGDNAFDLAICSHVLEHVEFPRELLREIKRISKMQVFEVPIDFSFRVDRKFKHFNSYGHINIYTPALFKYLLLTEGFEILNQHYALYSNEVHKFQNKKLSKNYLKIQVKRLIWKSIPILMKIKPNTYTVLVQ